MIDVAFSLDEVFLNGDGNIAENSDVIIKTLIGAPIYINKMLAGSITEIDAENGLLGGVLLYNPMVTIVNGKTNHLDFEIRERMEVDRAN